MDVHIRVDLDRDDPVVVKSATGPAAPRLDRERALLARAAHPGVVALAASPGGPGEVRTRYAGEPLARWCGTPAAVAGMGAAVATTLADLHDLGIVHGRLDASHILIGDDGRPRLCGWSRGEDATPAADLPGAPGDLAALGGPAPGDLAAADPPGAPGDVAALAGVLAEIAARAPTPRRGLLGPVARARRERDALRRVLGRATDPVPTRRPTARGLADALLAAVPAATLPPPAAGRRPAGTPPGEPGAGWEGGRPGEPDTLDRIWGYAGHETDEERWAAALGTGPPDLHPDPGGGRPEPLPMAEVDTPAWSTGRPRDRTPPGAGAGAGAGDPAGTGLAAGPAPPAAAAHDPTRSQQDPAPRAPAAAAHDPARRGGTPRRPAPVPRDDDPTREHRAAPGRVGPAPHAAGRGAEPGPAASGRRRAVLAAACLAAGCLAVAGAVLAGASGAARGRGTQVGSDPAPAPPGDGGRASGAAPTGGGDRAPAAGTGAGGGAAALGAGAGPAACPGAEPPAADIDGDGCRETLRVDGTTIDAGVARWSLGQPGDVVAVGDWDCDGQASAALLRPATGDVFVFPGWAAVGEPLTIAPTGRVDGGVGIRAEPGGGGCDRLMVDRGAGGAATVEVPR